MSAPTDTVANLASYLDQLAALNNLAVPSPPPPPPPPPPDPNTIFSDSFDTLNPAWKQVVAATWIVANGDIQQQNTSVADPRKLLLSGVAVPNDVQIVARVRADSWAAGDMARLGIGGRTGADGCGYNLCLRSNNRVQFLADHKLWSAPFAFSWSVGQWYWMKLAIVGTTLVGKVWVDGTTEPADWMFRQDGWAYYSTGSTCLTAGSGGVVSSYDDFAVSPAPAIPAPPPPPPPPPGALAITFTFNAGITPSQQAIFQAAALRWQQIIIEPNRSLAITAQGQTIDGQGGILGQGSPGATDTTRGLPVSGLMSFDSADLTWAESNGYLLDIITHEMGHVLGFGTIQAWAAQLTGFSTTDPRFTGPKATAAYNARFGKSDTGVPVEGGTISGTSNVHWRDSIFGRELMTGYYNAGQVNPISAVTVGAMADLGWNVNAAGAEAYLEAGPAIMSGTHDAYQVTKGLAVIGHDPEKTPHPRKRHKVVR